MCEAGGGGFAECIGRCATLSCDRWWLYEGGSLVEIVGSEAVAMEWCTPDPRVKSYTREDLIRVVVGQQWAVAIALWTPLYAMGVLEWQHKADCGLGPDENATDDEVRDYVERNAQLWAYVYIPKREWAPLADLPCAVDVVDGKEGA